MRKTKPTYRQLEKRLAIAEPIVEALKRQEVDAVVGKGKIAFLMLRKVEEAWLESNEEFSAMFDLHGIGMIQADAPAFRFTRVNPRFCEITGYTAEELLTKTYIGLTHAQDGKQDMKAVARVIRGKTDSWSIEKRCVRKDGGVVWVSVHGVALRAHAGQGVRIMAMVQDITARKLAEQRQQEAQKQLKKQLQERSAEVSEIRRKLRSPGSKRKLTEQVQRAIQEFLDRSIAGTGELSPAGAGGEVRRARGTSKKSGATANRRPSGKSRRGSG